MSLKILHTSDVHLGMKFGQYGEVKEKLVEARFEALKNIVNLANEKKCDLIVIAGDLYHTKNIPKKDILLSVEILNEFQGGYVLVLPGNHDFNALPDDDLWKLFKDKSGDRIILLEKPEPCSLIHYDLDVVIYPAPCNAMHSEVNRIGWIKDVEKESAVKYHIGVAHGSLEGFSPDFDKKYYPMTSQELKKCGLDFWLMGHTHKPYPAGSVESETIFFASTPEPDGLECKHTGHAWLLELDDRKKIKAEQVDTGTYQFLDEKETITEASEIEQLKNRFAATEYEKTILRLRLSGSLPKEEFTLLADLKKELENSVFLLDFDDSGVSRKITMEDINSEFTVESFPHRLLKELADKNESEALQTAYELIGECRQ